MKIDKKEIEKYLQSRYNTLISDELTPDFIKIRLEEINNMASRFEVKLKK
jgi:hypothetical protein